MMKKTGSALRRMTLAVLWRRRGVSLLLLLLAALGVFSAALLQNLALRQERSMADMIENTPIRCVVTNAQGASSDRLGMNSSFVDMLMGYRHERGCYADEAAKNVRAKASRPLQSPADTTLCRILSLASDSVLDPVSGAKVTFFSGAGRGRLPCCHDRLSWQTGHAENRRHGQRTDGCDDLVPVLCDHDRRTDRELFR